MTPEELAEQLQDRAPAAYMVFETPQQPPYIVYALPDTNVVHADNRHYHTIPNGWLELYMKRLDFGLMKRVEDVFISGGLPWEKENEVYIDSEKLFQARWSFVLI